MLIVYFYVRRAQKNFKMYGDTDMGSKRYTMEPTITVNVFWGEKDGTSLKMHNFCLGTRSFTLPPDVALTEKEQNAYNAAMGSQNDDDSESSSWGDIEEV